MKGRGGGRFGAMFEVKIKVRFQNKDVLVKKKSQQSQQEVQRFKLKGFKFKGENLKRLRSMHRNNNGYDNN
jgi:hypothetical protein